MAFESLVEDIKEVVGYLKSYIESNLTYYKLKALKKVVNACSVTFKILLCLVLLILTLFFLSIALAAFLGHLLGSFYIGFLIVGGFYLVLFILAVIFGMRIVRRPMLRMLASKIFKRK